MNRPTEEMVEAAFAAYLFASGTEKQRALIEKWCVPAIRAALEAALSRRPEGVKDARAIGECIISASSAAADTVAIDGSLLVMSAPDGAVLINLAKLRDALSSLETEQGEKATSIEDEFFYDPRTRRVAGVARFDPPAEARALAERAGIDMDDYDLFIADLTETLQRALASQPSDREGWRDILDKEEAALLQYRDEHCQGDDAVKRHSWIVADARIAEVRVLRQKLTGEQPAFIVANSDLPTPTATTMGEA